MKQVVTKAIVLTRTNYGEADRILTLITPSEGKLRLMAKGVRRPKSKLAGGVELFSVSDITFIRGKGDIGTLVSARLETHFGAIVRDVERTMLAYDILKQAHKMTEDEAEEAYYQLVRRGLNVINEQALSCALIWAWFGAQSLAHGGYTPELWRDVQDRPLDPGVRYLFDYDRSRFAMHSNGQFDANRIKLLRLLFVTAEPHTLGKITGAATLLPDCAALIETLARDTLGFHYQKTA